MAKGYWVSCYRSISDEAALAAYGKAAKPVLEAHGGRFLVRGPASKSYEAGLKQRVIVIEFDSVESAVKAYESPAYQAALKILGNAAERDLRIVEGVQP